MHIIFYAFGNRYGTRRHRKAACRISEKLDNIEKKQTEKWFLPVFILVVTSILGLCTFFIEHHFTKGDVRDNTESEINAGYVAKSKIAFYDSCQNYITAINEEFEGYCQFDRNEKGKMAFAPLLGAFRQMIANQQIANQPMIEKMQRYEEFVAQSSMDIAIRHMKTDSAMLIYQKSRDDYFNAAQTALRDAKRQLGNPQP